LSSYINTTKRCPTIWLDFCNILKVEMKQSPLCYFVQQHTGFYWFV